MIISIFTVAFFLLLNYLQPLRADDFVRANTDTLAKGLIIMVNSIQVDYMTWTGRVSAQALIYLLMSKKYIGLSLFLVNLINSIAFYVFMLISFKILGMFVGSIIGLYNEIFVCVGILLCLAYFFERMISKKVINDTVVAFFVSCAIGVVILVAAHGNYARLEHISSGNHSSLLQNILRLIYEIIFTPQYTLILLVMIMVFFILVFTNKNVKKITAIILLSYPSTIFICFGSSCEIL
ncbi:MAG: DUF6056 family protein [Francisella endosymbiont of Hyalomma asiaticum]